MTIGFEDISQSRVLDELAIDPASCGLALASFSHLATFASRGGGGRRGRYNHKLLLELSVVEI